MTAEARYPFGASDDAVGSGPPTALGLRSISSRWPWIVAVAIGLVAVACAWPFRTSPRYNLDLSWQIGLQQALEDGLRHGSDIMFTYGPLGFLAKPAPFVGPTTALAFGATAGVYLATMLVVFAAARRSFPLWAAIVITLVAARVAGYAILMPFEAYQFVAFALGIELLRRERVDHPLLVAGGAGILAAVAVLGKANVGVFVTAGAVAVVLAVSSARLLGLLAFAASLVVAFLVLWVASGQRLSDLVPFVHGSLDLISGYSDSMSVEHPGRRWLAAGFALLAAILVAEGYLGSAGWPVARRLALAAVLGLLLFALWKHGFVRDHFAMTFATLGLCCLVLLPPSIPTPASVAVLVVALAVALVGSIPTSASMTPAALTRLFNVQTPVTDFAHQLRDTVAVWRWDGARGRTRHQLARAFDVPPTIVAQLTGHTVHIDPYDAAVATAYPGFTWRPEPVFQAYSAYTPYLDGLNADALRSPDRPQRILRGPYVLADGTPTFELGISERSYWFETPAATLERLCRYREVAASDRWQVLADTGRSCGPAETIGTVTAARGEAVTVPEPPSSNDFVIVEVHGADDGLLGKLRAALWKSPEWYVTVDGNEFRLVQDTAVDGLLMSVPAAAQGSTPFAFGPSIHTISIREQGSGGGNLSYEFQAVPLAVP